MQRMEPTAHAEVAQSRDPALALDLALVRRLWRPVERPGVIDPGLARTILARHQQMVAGLPLAELVSRHTGSASDLAGTAVPIVYALPSQSPPHPDSRPSGAQLNVAAARPIVSVGPAEPVARSAQPVRSVSPQVALGSSGVPSVSPTVSVTHDAAIPLVVGRGLVTPPAAGSLPATPPPDSAVSLPDIAVPPSDVAVSVVRGPAVPDPRPLDLLPLDLHTPGSGSPDAALPDAALPDAGIASAGPAQSVAGLARSVSPQVAPGSSGVPSVSPAVSVTPDAAVPLVVGRRLGTPRVSGSPPATSPPDVAAPVVRRPAVPDPGSSDRLPLDLHTPGLRPADAGTADPRSPNPGSLRPGTPVAPDSPRALAAVVVTAGRGDAPPPARAAASATPLVIAARPGSWPSWERSAGTLVHPESGHPESGHPEVGHPEVGWTGRAVPVGAHRLHPRPEETLLLVDLAVATARAARDRPVAAEQREPRAGRTPVAGHVPGVGLDAGAPRSADRSAQAQVAGRRQATAPIDVEHIVDAVHRRFVRRLAIEAERRAVR